MIAPSLLSSSLAFCPPAPDQSSRRQPTFRLFYRATTRRESASQLGPPGVPSLSRLLLRRVPAARNGRLTVISSRTFACVSRVSRSSASRLCAWCCFNARSSLRFASAARASVRRLFCSVNSAPMIVATAPRATPRKVQSVLSCTSVRGALENRSIRNSKYVARAKE